MCAEPGHPAFRSPGAHRRLATTELLEATEREVGTGIPAPSTSRTAITAVSRSALERIASLLQGGELTLPGPERSILHRLSEPRALCSQLLVARSFQIRAEANVARHALRSAALQELCQLDERVLATGVARGELVPLPFPGHDGVEPVLLTASGQRGVAPLAVDGVGAEDECPARGDPLRDVARDRVAVEDARRPPSGRRIQIGGAETHAPAGDIDRQRTLLNVDFDDASPVPVRHSEAQRVPS
jgi:hypothetical protein